MKYSDKALWEAIGFILPSIKTAREMGKNFNLPTMLNTAAIQVFLELETVDFKLSYEKLVAAHVVRVALTELTDSGVMLFGDCDDIFK